MAVVAQSCLGIALAVGLFLGPSSADAQVARGTTVGPGEKVTLTMDLGPCDSTAGPALTVVGPATLDMAGATVTCTGGGTVGIRLEGENAQLRRGTVRGCVEGVGVTGDKNQLKQVHSVNNHDHGLVLAGSGNKLRGGTFSFNARDGVRVAGDGNTVERTYVTENGDGTAEDGGIEVAGSGNRIQQNEVINNSASAIVVVAGAQDNRVTKNLALANATLDLLDRNGPFCNGNRWTKNIFGGGVPDRANSPRCIE